MHQRIGVDQLHRAGGAQGGLGLATHGIDLAAPDGLNLWLPVRDERAAVLHLAADGIRVAGGTPFLAAGTTGDFVRVTSGLVHPEDAVEVAAALAGAVRA